MSKPRTAPPRASNRAAIPRTIAADESASTGCGAAHDGSDRSTSSVPKPSMTARMRPRPFSAASPQVRSPMAAEMTRPPW